MFDGDEIRKIVTLITDNHEIFAIESIPQDKVPQQVAFAGKLKRIRPETTIAEVLALFPELPA